MRGAFSTSTICDIAIRFEDERSAADFNTLLSTVHDELATVSRVMTLRGDIASDLRYADEDVFLRLDWRGDHGDVNPLTSFRSPNGFVMRDPLTGVKPSLNVRFFVVMIFGNDEINRLPQGFAGGVAVHLFGGVVPGADRAVEIFAVDRNVRGIDDRRQVRRLVKASVGHGPPASATRMTCRRALSDASWSSCSQTLRQAPRRANFPGRLFVCNDGLRAFQRDEVLVLRLPVGRLPRVLVPFLRP